MSSAQMQGLKKAMIAMMERGGMPQFGGNIDPIQLRQTIDAATTAMPYAPGITFIPNTFEGVRVELSLPENAREDAIIFYIHGGGLICGNAHTSGGYASMLASETKLPVYSATYRLAPENPFPAGVEDCLTAYKGVLVEHPNVPIFLIGESGGAYLCITTTILAKQNGLTLPAGIIPYSPVSDMSGELDRSGKDEKDFTVKAAGLNILTSMYCPDVTDLRNPLVSTIFADYTDFPPMLLAWDADETLAIDSERTAALARAAGVEVQHKAYPDCFHAFATSGRGTPESSEILDDTVVFVNRHI